MEKENISELKSLDLYVDSIVNNEKDDLVGMYPRAKECADILLNAKAPFIYGICSPWGTGKSSFLNMVEKEIEETEKNVEGKKPLVFFFNAWKHAYNEDIVIAFPVKFAQETKKIAKEKNGKLGEDFLKNEFTDLSKVLIDLANIGLTGIDLCTGLSTFTIIRLTLARLLLYLYDKRKEINDKLKNESKFARIREAFRNLVLKLNEKKFRVIVLIDEIDRCVPSEVVRLLDGIRVCFLDDSMDKGIKAKEDVVYAIAMDEEYVAKTYADAHKMNLTDSYTYLEKMIQYKEYLFTPNVKEIINDVLKKNGYDKFCIFNKFPDLIFEHIDCIGKISLRQVKKISLYYFEYIRRYIYEPSDQAFIFKKPIAELIKDKTISEDKIFNYILNSFLIEIAIIKVIVPYIFNRIIRSKHLEKIIQLNTWVSYLVRQPARSITRPKGEHEYHDAKPASWSTYIDEYLLKMNLKLEESDDFLFLAEKLRYFRRDNTILNDFYQEIETLKAKKDEKYIKMEKDSKEIWESISNIINFIQSFEL